MNNTHYPFLQLDESIARTNIRQMADKASRCNVKFRPHFKTHQSDIIGNWFREAGVTGITVSSVYMAEYFAENGWKDITIAFPVNILESNRLNELAASIDVNVLVIDAETAQILNTKLSNPVGVYIELDPNYGRSGIPMQNLELIEQLVSTIKESTNLELKGIYAHAGHTYKCRSTNEILETISPALNSLKFLKSKFGLPICFGDTPSCSVLEDYGPVDQISPGNFVFYDWMQHQIGSCATHQIAVTMMCPVIAKYPERKEILIHGGAVHFSKDSISDPKIGTYFGVVASEHSSFPNSSYLKSVSQEHGLLSCTPDFFEKAKIGDLIPIYPIHSCLTANLMRSYRTTTGKCIDHFGSI